MLNRVNACTIFGLVLLMMTGGCASGASGMDAGHTPPAAILLLPDCRSAEEVSGPLVDQLPPCRLKAHGAGAFITLTSDPVDLQPEGGLGFLTVSVTSRSGELLAEFSEVSMGRYAYPRLEDVNRDGLDDLLIPVSTGEGGLKQALWLQEETGDFVRVGALLEGNLSVHPGALLASSRQSSPMQWETRYFRLRGARLEEVAVVRARGGRPARKGGVCTIEFLADGEEARAFCRK